MPTNQSFLLNLSILYRNTQKFYDHVLAQYEIGSGQLIFLLYINEHEGSTMQDVTKATQVDKGTTTKAVNRLLDQDYIEVRTDEKDKRVKRLYTTEKTASIINDIYEYRKQSRSLLAQDTDFGLFEVLLDQVTRNSENGLMDETQDYSHLRIGGIQKMSLVDYPDEVASTIFTAGCNFKCPFCHNRDLVFMPEDFEYLLPEDILAYLMKRKGLLDGVCISGGEPLLQDGLEFIKQIKDLGYKIKLDTNGSQPEKLKEYVESGYIDYVAMDIKNCKEKYALTVGLDSKGFNLQEIEESVNYLKENHVPYEFRTTVVKEFHTLEDLISIAKWIGSDCVYYLQQFEDSGHLIQEGYHAYSSGEMRQFEKEIKKLVPHTMCRGLKEN